MEPEIVVYRYYYPPPVKEILASGSYAFIGLVDETTVLKYPLDKNDDMERLKAEYEMLKAVGPHPGVIAQLGFTSDGLYLERAQESIYSFLTAVDHAASSSSSSVSVQQRLTWSIQLAQAIRHVHASSVIHCDIQPHNVLLFSCPGGSESHVKLSDFQGMLLSDAGLVVRSGWSGEPCRYFCPRDDDFSADVQTDLFALGSTLYFFMTGREVFPDVVGGAEGWEDQIRRRFESGVFPEDSGICTAVTLKCWRREYGSAAEVVHDLEAIWRREFTHLEDC